MNARRAESGDSSMKGVLGLSWFDHRRTRELCAGLGIELVLLDTFHRGLWRYVLLTARTMVVLARRRPTVLVVQSPSLVLSLLGIAKRGVFGYRLIVDAHNEVVIPYENPQPWVRWLSRWVVRHADLTIVTNRQLAEIVQEQGGNAFVLPDKVPAPPPGGPRTLGDGFNVVLIATFAKDEPMEAIFEAVRGRELHLHVTGDPRKLNAALAAHVPPNVRFTGFLSEQDYWGLLRSANAIVDLTLKPNCLVCGAYEALALGKPMLLSDNVASLELFGDSAVFTDNSPQDIRLALDRLRLEQADLRVAAEHKRSELNEKWLTKARTLSEALSVEKAGARPQNV
jgi:glycosyltransferase involved in cell wall biosynthesis